MLTKAWTQLKPHPTQHALWTCRKKFAIVVAGRGSGKTELARRRVIRYLPVRKPWSDPLYFYALPTRDQAKRVAWEPLKALVPRSWLHSRSINESELSITTVFGSKLLLLGMDKPQRAEGVQYDGGVIDESSDQRPGMFDLSLMPAFSHRDPWCWRIGVPKRAGAGAREFKDAYEAGLRDDPYTQSFWWPSSDIVDEAVIARAKSKLTDKDYNEQYCAAWETVGGLVFYAFDEVLNVAPVQYKKDLPLLIGCDFNVDPMAWVVAQHVKDEIHVLDELFLRNTNTREALDYLWKKWGHHESGFVFYGDATGRARKTSASESDYVQIRNDVRFSQKRPARVMFPMSNPIRQDRFAACNAVMKSADGQRRLKVSPTCENLLLDIGTRAYKAGETTPDDHGDIGHITDALGYLITITNPLSVPLTTSAPGVFAR